MFTYFGLVSFFIIWTFKGSIKVLILQHDMIFSDNITHSILGTLTRNSAEVRHQDLQVGNSGKIYLARVLCGINTPKVTTT